MLRQFSIPLLQDRSRVSSGNLTNREGTQTCLCIPLQNLLFPISSQCHTISSRPPLSAIVTWSGKRGPERRFTPGTGYMYNMVSNRRHFGKFGRQETGNEYFKFMLVSSYTHEDSTWRRPARKIFHKEFRYGFSLEKLCINDFCNHVLYMGNFKREWRENHLWWPSTRAISFSKC